MLDETLKALPYGAGGIDKQVKLPAAQDARWSEIDLGTLLRMERQNHLQRCPLSSTYVPSHTFPSLIHILNEYIFKNK